MAIQQFGESLLTDVRERRRKEERRARRQADRDALLGLGLSVAGKIGTQYFNKKTNEFLQNEKFLNKNLEFKQQTKLAQKDITDYDSYLANPDYFIQEYITKYKPAYDSYAPADASSVSINQRIALDAQEHSEKRLAQLKDRIQQAREFISLSGGDENAYYNATIESRAKNPIDAAIKGLGNFITGGTLHDSALRTKLYSESQDYKTLYKENPTIALSSVQLMQQLKNEGVTFDKAPVTFDKPISIDVPDGFGGTQKESVTPIMQKGKYIGYQTQDGTTVSPYTKNQTKRNRTVSRVAPTPEKAYQIKAAVDEVITEDQKEALENIAVATYGREAENKDALEAGLQSMYGNLYFNSGMLQNQFGLSSRNSYAVAVEMEILRQQAIRGGETGTRFKGDKEMSLSLELETNADSVSPILMMAAIDSLAAKNVLGRSTAAYERLRTTAEESFQGDNPYVREFIETFDSLDVRTQKGLMRWMEQYPSLSQQRESGFSIIDQLQRKYSYLGNSSQLPSSRFLGY